MYYDKYKSEIPEGVDGDWRVEKFTVTKKDEELERMRAAFSSLGRYVPAGDYTRLMCNGTVVMSDTPDEIGDHIHAISMAKGNVLVNGLGLGVYACAVLEKPEVDHVTVVEIAPEVIRLVGVHLKQWYGERIELVLADAMTWQPPKGKRYDAVWHDIWDTICTDNLEQMHTLHRRYGRRCDWQGSWSRHTLERLRDSGW
ncbi:MAG: hypothetical protein GWN93_06070 [Deltaproteobacteria bacterium]|nr:hypothetical protein [Deltaproteobacteria bacterium]